MMSGSHIAVVGIFFETTSSFFLKISGHFQPGAGDRCDMEVRCRFANSGGQVLFLFSETGSHYVILAVLELIT